MWPWSQRQGHTCIKPINSSYSKPLCHFLSESVHIWQNDCLRCVVCLIWSFSSQSIFFQSSHVRMALCWVELTLSRIKCVLPVMSISCSLGHLSEKGWALPSLVCDVFCHLPLPYRVLGHVRYLIVSIPDLCLLLYFAHGQYAVPPVRLKPATLLSRLKHPTTGYCTRILCYDYDESFRLLLWPKLE